MAINNNYICVYDFETTGIDPNEAEIVDIAAAIVHPRKLEIVSGGTFHSFSRPPNFDEVSADLWDFHAKANQCSVGEIKQKIAEAPPIEDVWKNFATFLGQYHAEGTKRKSIFSSVIRAGMNIISYDNIIWDRMCKRYGMTDKNGKQNLSFPRDNIDLLNLCFLWFENRSEPLKYNMDALREYFGVNQVGHTALGDVQLTTDLITRFMRLHRTITVKFENSLRD
jgi:DNA polymerase III epsilon subunit-like protein